MKQKLVFGVIVTVVLIALWVVTATFTGNAMGEGCNTDGDCKGMNAACVSSPTEKYCTIPCENGAGCTAGYTCSTVEVTQIDGHGKMTAAGSKSLCTR